MTKTFNIIKMSYDFFSYMVLFFDHPSVTAKTITQHF